MKKIILFFVLTTVFLFLTAFVTVNASIETDGCDYIMLDRESFTIDNNWTASDHNYGYNGKSVTMRAGSYGVTTSAYFQAEKSTEYKVWARAADYQPEPGVRSTHIQINNGYVEKKAGAYAEKNTSNTNLVWNWECLGTVKLNKDVVNKMTLHADHTFSRFDCVVLTDSTSYMPTDEDVSNKRINCLQLSSSYNYNEALFPKTASYCINADGFSYQGTWVTNGGVLDVSGGARDFFFKSYLTGVWNYSNVVVEDAVSKPYIFEEGDYYVWVRTGMPSASGEKRPRIQMEINGVLTKGFNEYNAEKEGFTWTNLGAFHFNKGNNRIALKDLIRYYARINCVYITKEGDVPPSSYFDTFQKQYTHLNLIVDSIDIMEYPKYVQNDNLTPLSTASISNENITVDFYNVNDGTHSFVQNKVTYKGDVLKNRSDRFVRQLYRYGAALLKSHERGSPILKVTPVVPMTTAEGDWTVDTAWGVPANKMWTNVGKFNVSNKTAYDIKGETVVAKLNIPSDGYYYGVTRGNSYDGNTKRGYTVKVDGVNLTTSSAKHYFNITNAEQKKFAFSYNSDPIYLKKGIVEVEMTSYDEFPMRTSFFSLIPAKNTEELEETIGKLTNYNTAISMLGGDALEKSLPGEIPITTTGYPHPITYDYVVHIEGVEDVEYGYQTAEVTRMGIGEWLIPVSAVQTSKNKVTIKYSNYYVDATEVWELSEEAEEPQVTFTVTAKKRGSFAIVVPTHNDYDESQYEYALAPMQYRGHGMPDKSLLITEQYMFTPMVSVSLPTENDVVPGKQITYGYTFEPSWIENRWVYKDDYEFGATMRGSTIEGMNKVLPSIVAPAQGGRKSSFSIGDTYTFKFRPIYRTDDWYGTFEHVISDLFEFRDYRENYYNSVTDAILNTTELMMDDFYGGWDDNSMGFWNMEGRGFVSNSSPLAMVQRYLLSDNEEILRERTIPTVISSLTRATHFKADMNAGGATNGYVGGSDSWPTKVTGTPSSYFGASVIGGIYEMSNGTIQNAKTAAEKLVNKIDPEEASSGNYISDLVAMYKYTGEEKYLSDAIKVADNYLVEMNKTIQSSTPRDYSNFAYVSFMPFLSGLIDVYEVTGEQKYLDAAEYAGQVVLTLIWTVGIDGERAYENMVLNSETVGTRPFMKDHNFWWHGDFQWRPGVDLDENFMPTEVSEVSASVHELRQLGFDEIEEEIVPAWVPSRVGIGLEQPSTFYGQSLNMIMSNWSPDMMRLAEYTGNELFEAAARNAIVGRFGTYPGYYLDRFVTLQMKENYHRDSPVDISSVYWHHIPPFMSMIEDFVIAQAWNWSDKQIEFPSIRQQGYAYFNNKQYGHEPGKFFNEDNMWLWIDSDVVNTNSVNIDWIAAKKDGVMGIALMNASPETITTEIELGEKADSDYCGKIRVYSADGSYKYVDAAEGKFTVTVPGHSLVAPIIYSKEIREPSFANNEYIQIANTVTDVAHSDVTGGGFLMQFNPSTYYAHIYVQNTFKDETSTKAVSKIEVEYSFGDSKNKFTASDNVYPFETTIEALDQNAESPIHYVVKTFDTDGKLLETSKLYTLTPMICEEKDKVVYSGNTIVLTGRNVQSQMSDEAPGNSWDHKNYILNKFGYYAQNAEDTTITISVPESGTYYIYANIRAGHSSYPSKRSTILSVTQNGTMQNVVDSDGNPYLFGYSTDVQEKQEEIIADDYWEKGLGVMAPIPLKLEKGFAEVHFDFNVYSGFDFFLFTNDNEVMQTLDACRVYENCDIFKFRASDSALKEMLEGFLDHEAKTPVVEPIYNSYSSSKNTIRIDESSLKNCVSVFVYVNDALAGDAYNAFDVLKNEGMIVLDGLKNGDEIKVSVLDDHGNVSAFSEEITIVKQDGAIRPEVFANLASGKNYNSVQDAEQANALPNGYFVMFTQDNFELNKSYTTKNDTDLFNGDKSNYYSNSSSSFTKAYSAEFVIPESEDGTKKFYQFISSYLRSLNNGSPYTDNRRTQFILIDGKALTENGLVEWNGLGTYNGTDDYKTNSYVFGSEYPHEYSYVGSTTPEADLCQNYPHSVMKGGHMWGYSPAVYLEPGVHTVDVYCVGYSNWFNTLIITEDIGYDITNLFFGGLSTRAADWSSNYNKVAKPLYTDFVSPTFVSEITYKTEGTNSVLSWDAATDAGTGSDGKVVAYSVKVFDYDGNMVLAEETFDTSIALDNLINGTQYTVEIAAIDGLANRTTISDTFTASASAYSYIRGEKSGILTLNAAADSSFVGDNLVYIVGYNKTTGKVDSIKVYPISVDVNKSKQIEIPNPAYKPNVSYKMFIWNKQLRPLTDFVVPQQQ